ncbi:MAG: hypothetical protein IKN54_02515, partial [Lachnospiraceae bacterium]|nr:hypothetical protein [Lachnospiraceae bacterium]
DELDYLKAELQNVIERVHEETKAPIRTSVNFYRDEGDEYEVKYYDFRDDAAEVDKLLEDEHAAGGGDYPEAVHTALDNALNQHNWEESSTVKLMFFVLDAPPHEEVAEKIQQYTVQAAQMGVRIIPVVASGADDMTQQLMRIMSIMTGGTYLFLDDNSGVGDSHEIPKDVNDYKSEHLNDMLIRVIGEYCGKEISQVEIEKPTEEQTTTYTQ